MGESGQRIFACMSVLRLDSGSRKASLGKVGLLKVSLDRHRMPAALFPNADVITVLNEGYKMPTGALEVVDACAAG